MTTLQFNNLSCLKNRSRSLPSSLRPRQRNRRRSGTIDPLIKEKRSRCLNPSASTLSTSCRLSKYHSQKSESTRRKIFNRDSTLQLIVQISSGNVNSSARARAKTHGRTPVSIELPRGRHLGSDACIS